MNKHHLCEEDARSASHQRVRGAPDEETQTRLDKWDPQNDQNQQLVQDQLDDAQFKA